MKTIVNSNYLFWVFTADIFDLNIFNYPTSKYKILLKTGNDEATIKQSQRVCACAYVRACVCVCVRVRACVRACVCVCVRALHLWIEYVSDYQFRDCIKSLSKFLWLLTSLNFPDNTV